MPPAWPSRYVAGYFSMLRVICVYALVCLLSNEDRANSRKLQATHLMRGAALRMASCCAVTIRARAQKRQCPNKAAYGYAVCPAADLPSRPPQHRNQSMTE